MQAPMSNYQLTPLTTLPSLAVKDTKEKRRKLLEEVRQRRKIIYQRFRQRMQHTSTTEPA
jgi:hypothetical protein